jgi:hypothetical protein
MYIRIVYDKIAIKNRWLKHGYPYDHKNFKETQSTDSYTVTRTERSYYRQGGGRSAQDYVKG